jgi:surface protein
MISRKEAETYKAKGNMMQPDKAKEINQIISKENEIKLVEKVEQKDINKDIYFLDNFNQVNHFHDNLKELKELNTELFINNKKYKYAKCFKTKNVGLYEIKIKFNIKIKDCSYMFCGCSNITSIDLSSFDTKNVTNMNNMFDKCYNLTSIDLSSFNTENVSNMSYMFSVCSNLKEINLSSFNTKNVTDMRCMFNYCSNLKNVDLSSFDTTNVTNINNIFNGCPELNLVKINSISYNLIQELQSKNKNTRIVDQSGKNIPDINNKYQRSFSIDFGMNNLAKVNNNQNIYNSMINFKNY